MFPHKAVVIVMAFPPEKLLSFIGTTPPSDFLSCFSCPYFIIACSTYSLFLRDILGSPELPIFPTIQHAMLLLVEPTFGTTPKQLYDTGLSHHTMVVSRRGTLSPCLLETYEANSLQLSLTACCLAYIVLNIWSYLRLPDACYLVVDLPYQSGVHTHWNY